MGRGNETGHPGARTALGKHAVRTLRGMLELVAKQGGDHDVAHARLRPM